MVLKFYFFASLLNTFASMIFTNSNSIAVNIAIHITAICTPSGICGTLNQLDNTGIVTIATCNSIAPSMQSSISLFVKSPILNTDFLSDLQINANNNSIIDKVTNTAPLAIVASYIFSKTKYNTNIIIAFNTPGTIILAIRNGVNKLSFEFLGFCFIIFLSSL